MAGSLRRFALLAKMWVYRQIMANRVLPSFVHRLVKRKMFPERQNHISENRRMERAESLRIPEVAKYARLEENVAVKSNYFVIQRLQINLGFISS